MSQAKSFIRFDVSRGYLICMVLYNLLLLRGLSARTPPPGPSAGMHVLSDECVQKGFTQRPLDIIVTQFSTGFYTGCSVLRTITLFATADEQSHHEPPTATHRHSKHIQIPMVGSPLSSPSHLAPPQYKLTNLSTNSDLRTQGQAPEIYPKNYEQADVCWIHLFLLARLSSFNQ